MIARISAARPKIADYPFTTLTPNLGVVTLSDDRSFVVADVPGLIRGAHAGQGLGDRFLRHIERTKVLIHLVDVSSASGRDPVEDFDTIVEELRLFDPKVAAKPQIVAANKIDALDDRSRLTRLEKHVKKLGLPLHRISGVTGEGVNELLEAAWRQLRPSGQRRRRRLAFSSAVRSRSYAISTRSAASPPHWARRPPVPAADDPPHRPSTPARPLFSDSR